MIAQTIGFNRPMYSAVDHQFMSEALAQAQKSLYLSNPNPRVGCVIVKDGQVIGRGHTQKVGGPHAEPLAVSWLETRTEKEMAYYPTLLKITHAIIKEGFSNKVIVS